MLNKSSINPNILHFLCEAHFYIPLNFSEYIVASNTIPHLHNMVLNKIEETKRTQPYH